MTTGIPPHAEARKTNEGWYVFWDNGLAYGAINDGYMTEEDAVELAGKVKTGEVKP